MRNKKLYSLAMAVTVSLLLFTGCGDKGEPVTADSESQAYTNENGYPIDQTSGTGDTSGEIVEAEKPVSDTSAELELDETVGIPEEDLIANDADEVDSINVGYTIIPIDDITLYAISKCNIRKGPSTEYDIVGSLSYAQEIIVNGKVEDGDKIWYVIKTDNSDSDNLQMVSAGLLSETKPVQQQSTGNTSNTENTSNTSTQQPSAETQQPPTTNDNEASNVPGTIGFGGVPVTSDNDGNGAGEMNLQ